jgi:dTDP-4-dehydrorhamnose 3,5-epimerase
VPTSSARRVSPRHAAISAAATQLGERHGLRLAVPHRANRDIGDVIVAPDSPLRIEGVQIEPRVAHPDDRGFFTELSRLGTGDLASNIYRPGAALQLSAAETYPGVIKAVHYHFVQTDVWFPLTGMLQVMLCDLRMDSATFGRVNSFYIGIHRRWALLIPPGVGHGYKVVGAAPATLIYLSDRHYSPADEGRLAYDDPNLNYDWETQHK